VSDAPDTPVEPKVDGRRLRAERTHNAIVDGLLALIEEGNLKPTAPQIAERAEVSLRTVFQHFTEVEQLFAAVSERQIERIVEMVRPVDPALPLPDRFDAFAAQRIELLEHITPIARAAQLQEALSPMVRAEADRMRQLGRVEVARTFAPELDTLPAGERDRLCAALVAAVTWRTWEALRTEVGLDRAAAGEVMRFSVGALLAAAGFPVTAGGEHAVAG
jgi:TetR/AcrR family transcriptional regulator, regulator of autoinduction and epiphytic fitness